MIFNYTKFIKLTWQIKEYNVFCFLKQGLRTGEMASLGSIASSCKVANNHL